MHTHQSLGRTQQVTTVSRQSRALDSRALALRLAELVIILAWLLVLLGFPSVTDSSAIRAWVAGIAAWVLALATTSFLLHNPRKPSAPKRFLLLCLSALAWFQLAALLQPEVPLPTPYTAVVPPLALSALIYWCRFLFVTFVRPNPKRGLLLAPTSSLSSLNIHINKYERSLGLTITGVMGWDDHLPVLATPLPNLFDQIVEAMRDCRATVLVLTVASITSLSDMQDFRWQLENLGLELDIVVEPTCLGPDTVDITAAPGLALLHTSPKREPLIESALRRCLDLVVSTILIVALTPLWLVLIYLIRRQDGGPAFFLQERVGRSGVTFPMVKFRTMVTNAEVILEELRAQEQAEKKTNGVDTGVLFKLERDPRITPIGSLLRRTSIDELPQLFNVWWGHMSLVGPRPPLPREVAQYLPRVMRKFNVRPGMTGLWQVSGRSNLSWEESVRLDLFYVQNRTLAFDIRILLKTIPAVLFQDGAY